MQQGIKAGDTLWLRFKYYSFFDLDPKVSPAAERRGLGQADVRTEGRGLRSTLVTFRGLSLCPFVHLHPFTNPATQRRAWTDAKGAREVMPGSV